MGDEEYGTVVRGSPSEESQHNITIFQAFEWYVPGDQLHWRRLRAVLPSLKELGILWLWLPPGCKASGPYSNGYDIYDPFDLGEFDWKMSRATKWGLKDDLIAMAQEARSGGLKLLWDAVLNHRASADYKEQVIAVEVDPVDRRVDVSEPRQIEAWTGFKFPQRGNKYSSQKYDQEQFSATDYDASQNDKGIYRFSGKQWAKDVDNENGNDDFLMFCNVDYNRSEVTKDVCHWGQWIAHQVPLQGMRLDAIRHIPRHFIAEFMSQVRKSHGPDFYFLGEYWKTKLADLCLYLESQSFNLSLFDAPLLYRLAYASQCPNADLRTLLQGTLANKHPLHAVKLVNSHDAQPGQALSPEATVLHSFRAAAYAFILLRTEGTACVFYGDLYGTRGPYAEAPIKELPALCRLRHRFAYGPQHDSFDEPNCIGWTREGDYRSNGVGLAILIANYNIETHEVGEQASTGAGASTPAATSADAASTTFDHTIQAAPATVTIPTRNSDGSITKRLYVGHGHIGEKWKAIVGGTPGMGTVIIDSDGKADFRCPADGLAIWLDEQAPGLTELNNFNPQIYERSDLK